MLKKILNKKIYMIASILIIFVCLIYLFMPKKITSLVPVNEHVLGCSVILDMVTSSESKEIIGDDLIVLMDILKDKHVRFNGLYSTITTGYDTYYLTFYSESSVYGTLMIDKDGNVYMNGIQYKTLDNGESEILAFLDGYSSWNPD